MTSADRVAPVMASLFQSDDGLTGIVGLRQRRKLSQGQRLGREAQPVIAHLLRRHAALFSDDLGHGQPAEAALAGSHAATQERLHLVRPAAAQLDGLAHLRGRDLLAAADDGVTDGAPEGVRRLVERVEELAAPHGTGQRVARHHGLAVAFTGIDAAQQMRRLQRGQTPAVLGRQCACDAGAIARHADAVDRSQPPFVDLRLPTVQRVVPAVFHAHRARQVHVRDHALVQHQLIGRQRLRDAAGGVAHAMQLVFAQRFQRRHALDDGHGGLDGAQQLQPFTQIGRPQETPDPGQCLAHASGRRGFQQRVDLHAGVQVLPGHQIQQRAAAGQHSAVGRHHARGFQQDLRRARRNDAGHRPARDGEGTLLGARGQQQPARVHDARLARHRIRHLEAFLRMRGRMFRHGPDSGARHIARAGLLEGRDQRRPMPIVFAQDAAVGHGRGGDGPIDLSARRRLFIQQHRDRMSDV
ncbi:hypothetical protein G6F35_011213 [Rhizopus arrhizus]|nr:hypothetical protein G6F35_011213 [Rhizopus arrhizus]